MNHQFNDDNKCIFCGSTKAMIEKHGWNCSPDRVPLDRIINENVYNEQRRLRRLKELSESKDPWEQIIYTVYYVDGGIENLTEIQRDYFILNSLLGETYNGGIERYFGNSSGSNCLECIRVLNKHGLNEVSNGMSGIISYFVTDKILTSGKDIQNEVNKYREILGDKYWEYWESDRIKNVEKLIDKIAPIFDGFHNELLKS